MAEVNRYLEQTRDKAQAPKPPPAIGLTPSSARDAERTLDEPEQDALFSGRSLFLAWSNRGSSTATIRDDMPPSVAPLCEEKRDHGMWLLKNLTTRRSGWARLSDVGSFPCSLPVAAPPFYEAVKHAADAALSLSLLLLFMPLFALIAVAVKLDSPGPVFFRQRRIGKDGSVFVLWKFRSMYTGAQPYAFSPVSARDPRLTRIGRLIRRISMDELPQLINVLRGEMGLVGPRPEMPFIVAAYTSAERQRLAVKPGITGLWQVSPGRALPIHENLNYDLHYLRNRNLLLDTAILLRTVVAVIRGVGAI